MQERLNLFGILSTKKQHPIIFLARKIRFINLRDDKYWTSPYLREEKEVQKPEAAER